MRRICCAPNRKVAPPTAALVSFRFAVQSALPRQLDRERFATQVSPRFEAVNQHREKLPAAADGSLFQSSNRPSERDTTITEFALSPTFGTRMPVATLGTVQGVESFRRVPKQDIAAAVAECLCAVMKRKDNMVAQLALLEASATANAAPASNESNALQLATAASTVPALEVDLFAPAPLRRKKRKGGAAKKKMDAKSSSSSIAVLTPPITAADVEIGIVRTRAMELRSKVFVRPAPSFSRPAMGSRGATRSGPMNCCHSFVEVSFPEDWDVSRVVDLGFALCRAVGDVAPEAAPLRALGISACSPMERQTEVLLDQFAGKEITEQQALDITTRWSARMAHVERA